MFASGHGVLFVTAALTQLPAALHVSVVHALLSPQFAAPRHCTQTCWALQNGFAGFVH
jgi:hypothetical protein